MPIEAKDILDYLGIDGVEKMEDFRGKFEPSYIKKSMIDSDDEIKGSLFGKVAGTLETEVKSELKKVGVELADGEFKGMKIEKVVATGLQKLNDYYAGKIKEISETAGKGSDEKYKALEEKYQKLEGKYKDTDNLLKQSTETWNKKESEFNQSIKNVKLQHQLGREYEGIKWKSGITEIEKKGFHAHIGEKYKIDFDEKEILIPLTTDGHRIPDPKKNGEFKRLSTILEEEGVALGVWETNTNVKDRVPPRAVAPAHQNRQPDPVFQGRQRVLSERARANEGRS